MTHLNIIWITDAESISNSKEELIEEREEVIVQQGILFIHTCRYYTNGYKEQKPCEEDKI